MDRGDLPSYKVGNRRKVTQARLVADVVAARGDLREAGSQLREAMLRFSDVIDRRGDEEYEPVGGEDDEEGDE